MSAHRSIVRTWLELLRVPNLPTVPGDPLAGFVLASIGGAVAWDRAVPPAAAAVLFYAAGLFWNDLADRSEDRAARPERPLPSGRATSRQVAVAGLLFALAGVGVAALAGRGPLLMAVLLVGLVGLYTFGPHRKRWGGTKQGRFLSALNMGACRGVSVLLGASAAATPAARPMPAGVGAAGVAVMIAAVTGIANRETETVRIGPLRWGPAISVAALFAWLMARLGVSPLSLGCAVLAVAALALPAHRLRGCPAPHAVGSGIGSMIRALLPVQAGLCACHPSGGAVAAMILLLAWPLSAMLKHMAPAS